MISQTGEAMILHCHYHHNKMGKSKLLLRTKSLKALVPNQIAGFLLGPSTMGRRGPTKSDASTVGDHTEAITEPWEEDVYDEDGQVRSNEKMTIGQAKVLMEVLEKELAQQKQQKLAMEERCQEDLAVAEARRDSGCQRGFLLSFKKMEKHQKCVRNIQQAIDCIETVLLVLSTEVNQVQAIADLSGQVPSDLKLCLTYESLKQEIDLIFEDAGQIFRFAEKHDLARELRAMGL